MHVFLSGAKQVGKSTLIRKILENASFSYEGLLSFSCFENGDRKVFLKPVCRNLEPELAGICSHQHVMERHPEVFDSYGVSVLQEASKAADVVVIDEIGNIEKQACRYSECVKALVSSDRPVVLGVLQDMASSELAEFLRSSDNITWYRVEESNREDLATEIVRRIEDELHG